MAIIALPNRSMHGRIWVNPAFVALVSQSGEDVAITLSNGDQFAVLGDADEVASKLNKAMD